MGNRWFKTIACVTSVILLAISIFSHGPATYRYAVFFLGPFLWAVYGYRERLNLHPLHFLFFALGLLLHDMGAFGAYRRDFFHIEFDTYVHFYFGLAGGFVV